MYPEELLKSNIKLYKNNRQRSVYSYIVSEKEKMYDSSFHLKLFDNNIFNCNPNVDGKVNIISLDNINAKIIQVNNIYNNPHAIRTLIKETPFVLNKQVSPSAYPGYVSTISSVALTDLESKVKYLVLKNFKYLGFKFKTFVFPKMKFSTGVYTRNTISNENTALLIHKEFKLGVAGVIYFNLENEYNGGTSFYDEDFNLEDLNENIYNIDE